MRRPSPRTWTPEVLADLDRFKHMDDRAIADKLNEIHGTIINWASVRTQKSVMRKRKRNPEALELKSFD